MATVETQDSVDRCEPPDSAQLEPRRIVDVREALRLVKATDCKQSALTAQHRARGNAVPLEQQLDGLGRSPVLVPAELAQFRVEAPGFPSRIGLRRQAPREHDLRVLELRELPLELVLWPEVISFENGDILSTRHLECPVVGAPQTRDPKVALRDIANSCVRELIDDLSCSVSRAVVNDDLFPARLGLGKDALDTWADIASMVVCRRDDADEGTGRCCGQ
jgi:hypothetical protein